MSIEHPEPEFVESTTIVNSGIRIDATAEATHPDPSTMTEAERRHLGIE